MARLQHSLLYFILGFVVVSQSSFGAEHPEQPIHPEHPKQSYKPNFVLKHPDIQHSQP